jgi:hypothetical protein
MANAQHRPSVFAQRALERPALYAGEFSQLLGTRVVPYRFTLAGRASAAGRSSAKPRCVTSRVVRCVHACRGKGTHAGSGQHREAGSHARPS